jgi:hypothetical protein
MGDMQITTHEKMALSNVFERGRIACRVIHSIGLHDTRGLKRRQQDRAGIALVGRWRLTDGAMSGSRKRNARPWAADELDGSIFDVSGQEGSTIRQTWHSGLLLV